MGQDNPYRSIASGCVPGPRELKKKNIPPVVKFRHSKVVDNRMACFVDAVVSDSVAVIVCRSSEDDRVLVRHTQISLCCLVLDVLFIAADCGLMIFSSGDVCFLWHTSTSQLQKKFWTYNRGHKCRPSFPFPVIAFIFFGALGSAPT